MLARVMRAANDPSPLESLRRRIDALVEGIGADTSLGRTADGAAAAVAEVDAVAALVQATWLPDLTPVTLRAVVTAARRGALDPSSAVARPDDGDAEWAPATLADILARATPSLSTATMAERRAAAAKEAEEARAAQRALAEKRGRGGAFLALLTVGARMTVDQARGDLQRERQQAAAAEALVDVTALRAWMAASPPFALWVALRALRRALARPVCQLGRMVAGVGLPWEVPGLGRGLVVWALFAVVAAARHRGGPQAVDDGRSAGPYRARPTFARSHPKRREVEWLAHLRQHRGRDYLDASLLSIRHMAFLETMGPDPTVTDEDDEHTAALDHHEAALNGRCHEIQALVIRCEIPGALLHEAYTQVWAAISCIERESWGRLHRHAVAAAERLAVILAMAVGVPCATRALEAELVEFARSGVLPHGRSRRLYEAMLADLHTLGHSSLPAQGEALRLRDQQLDHAMVTARAAVSLGDSLNPFAMTPAEQELERAGRARVEVVMALDEIASRGRAMLAEVVRRHPRASLVLGAEAIWSATRQIHVVAAGKHSHLIGKWEALQHLQAWRERALALVPLVSPTEVAGALASYDFDVYLHR